MEERKKIFTRKEYLNRPVKCCENGIIFEDIKEMCGLVYGVEFKQFNDVGKSIDRHHPIRGNHYIWY